MSKPFIKPCMPRFYASRKKWLIVMKDGCNPPTYLHDDLEYYENGCLDRSQYNGNVTIYKTTAEFDIAYDAESVRIAYIRKHVTAPIITASQSNTVENSVETVESEVMEFI